MGEHLYRSRATNGLRGKRREEGSGWAWGGVGRVGRLGGGCWWPGLRLIVWSGRGKAGQGGGQPGQGVSFRLPRVLGAQVLESSPRKTVLCTGARNIAAPS